MHAHAHDVSKQIPLEKKFSIGLKIYKTIGSCISCAFIEIWSTWEVWRALKKLELLKAMPRATLTHLSCSPNFPCASYLDERTLTYEPIVKWYRQWKILVDFFNPFYPSISMHILYTVLYTFPKVLTRKVCLKIKNFFSL